MISFPHVVCASGMRLGVPADDVIAAAEAAMRHIRAEIDAAFRVPSRLLSSGPSRVDDDMVAIAWPRVTEIARGGVSAPEGRR